MLTIPVAFTLYKGIEVKYSDARRFYLQYYSYMDIFSVCL